ncbi:MAG: YafY family protein [Clostridia bacterium]
MQSLSNLFSMLLDLINYPQITAHELASKLEVSERSIYRYVDTLSFAQIPIICTKGRNGGIKIGDEFKLYAQFLTAEERELLITTLETMPLGKTSENIKNKLLSLEKNNKSRDMYRSELFAVDKTSFGNNDIIRSKMQALQDSRASKKVIKITYHDRSGKVTEREIEPYVIVYGDGIWYIFAWCLTRNEMRLFKISRITHIQQTEKSFEKRQYNTSWDLTNPNTFSEINIVLKVFEAARYDIEEWLGIESVKKSADGAFWIAQGVVSDSDMTINKLFSYRENIEVLSPISIREKLRKSLVKTLDIYQN